MNSYPLIQAELSQTEQRFVDFVERHAAAHDLAPDRIRLHSSTSLDDDCHRALHEIEVLDEDAPVRRIVHSMRTTEAQQSRVVVFETSFELSGPGIPVGYGRRDDIEAAVDACLRAIGKPRRRFARSGAQACLAGRE